jgi:glutathione S-transferase
MPSRQESMKIYGVPMSVHTRKVILAARIKSIPYVSVPVIPVVPDNPPSNWRSISPTGLIPAIDDGGYVLADSTAIVLYLERRSQEPALLPSGASDYGRALFLDSWAGSELFRRVIHPTFHEQVVAPRIRKERSNDAVIIAALEKAAPEAFAYLESLAPEPFLVGNALSIADLAVVSNLVLYHYLGYRIDVGRYPKLATYFGLHLKSPALAAALEDERPFVENMGLDRRFLS